MSYPQAVQRPLVVRRRARRHLNVRSHAAGSRANTSAIRVCVISSSCRVRGISWADIGVLMETRPYLNPGRKTVYLRNFRRPNVHVFGPLSFTSTDQSIVRLSSSCSVISAWIVPCSAWAISQVFVTIHFVGSCIAVTSTLTLVQTQNDLTHNTHVATNSSNENPAAMLKSQRRIARFYSGRFDGPGLTNFTLGVSCIICFRPIAAHSIPHTPPWNTKRPAGFRRQVASMTQDGFVRLTSGRTDPSSSPCPTPRRSRARTSPDRRCKRTSRRWRGVGSWSRTPGQRLCPTT